MSQYGKTKSEIISLIRERRDTLSEISRALGLAPSTINKHLKELSEMGIIRLVDSDYAKKWKHYTLTDVAKVSGPETVATSNMKYKKAKYISFLLASIVAIAGLLMYLHAAGSVESVPVSITDPPYIPAGTNSVLLNYSSIIINYTYNRVNMTATLNSSGTINAISLVNVTRIIAMAKIRSGAVIKGVSINISSGSIQIGNATYPLTIPVKHFYTSVIGNGKVNSSTSILIDLSSVVVPYFSANSTGAESFAFLPKLSSVLGSINSRHAEDASLKNLENGGIANVTMPIGLFGKNIIYLFRRPSVMIENTSIASNKGVMGFEASLINTGNGTISLEGIAVLSCIFGPRVAMQANLSEANNSAEAEEYNSSDGTLTINVSKLYNGMNWSQKRMQINVTHRISRIVIIHGSYGLEQTPEMYEPEEVFGLSFGVLENGSLSPAMWEMPAIRENKGYQMAPHSESTFTYSTSSNSIQGQALNAVSKNGNYRIIAFTSNGIAVYYNERNATGCG